MCLKFVAALFSFAHSPCRSFSMADQITRKTSRIRNTICLIIRKIILKEGKLYCSAGSIVEIDAVQILSHGRCFICRAGSRCSV
jgi:hypothetical protein